MFTVCTVHAVNLKEGLVEPAITTAYKHGHKRLVDEIAEEEAFDGATCPTPLGLQHATVVWGGFERALLLEAPGDDLATSLAWALLVERLLDAVVTAVRGPDYPPHDIPRHEHRAWWLRKMALSIEPDREHILAFLFALPISAHRRAALACLGRLVEDELRRRTVMSRLPLQDIKDRLLASDPAPQAKSTGALPRAMHPVGHKSLEAVEAILGGPASLLHHLVREQHFKGVKKIKFGRKQYVFVPDEEVERFRRLFATCMTFDQLLRHLAIDRQAYWVLHDSGLLDPIELGSWRRYRRQDVTSLVTRLDHAARPIPARSQNLEPLMGPWLHMRRRARSLIRGVLDELFDGRLPLYKSLEREGLQAYFVDRAAPSRLRWLSVAHYAAKAKERSMTAQLPLWEAA